jgi:excisionase family DNA binding protein
MALLLKVTEAAERIGVSRAKAWEWVRSGRLGSVKIEGMRRVRQEDIDAFMASLADDQQRREASA